MTRTILLVFIVVAGAQALQAQRAEWIGPDRGTVDRDVVTLQTKFQLSAKPELAQLRIATDFCEVTVSLNGHVVHRTSPLKMPLPIDVQRSCQQGENVLSVAARGDGGPMAIALELDVKSIDRMAQKETAQRDREAQKDKLGNASAVTQRIVSDASWKIEDSDANAISYGYVDIEPWWSISTHPSTTSFDEYNQWRDAADEKGVRSAQLQVSPGFEMDVAYIVPKEHGSWISMAADDQGRLLVGCENDGILRVTFGDDTDAPEIERINDDLKSCHGLLWSKGELFANASNKKALYKLSDTNGDDSFDKVVELRHSPGGGGDHGRNDLVEGPDGSIYSIHGDSVDVPDGFTCRVPITREFSLNDGRPKGGHVIRTDRDGEVWEVFASGLRNPYGIAMNRDGELFTYDADSEKHVGLPYYRPTRMNHLVAGVDYGWRHRDGETPWPMYYADILPPNTLIGRGSPTSARFGYQLGIEGKYEHAMFVGDWSFGRLFAVHVVPRGATYSMHPETILRGRPLNLVDLERGPNGSAYLLTGGRKTRSVLYRLRHVASTDLPPDSPQMRAREQYSQKMRALRRTLESASDQDSELAIKYLAHPDRWIQSAARIALERSPNTNWREARFNLPGSRLPTWLAAARVALGFQSRGALQYPYQHSMKEDPKSGLAFVRVLQTIESYHSCRIPDEVFEELGNEYPTGHVELDREICSILVRRDEGNVIRATLDLFANDLAQTDALHFLSELSKATNGWTEADREEYFRILQGASLFRGDEFLEKVVSEMQTRALANVPEAERDRFATLLKPAEEPQPEDSNPRDFVRDWTLADFPAEQVKDLTGDEEAGEKIFRDAQCAKCHRYGRIGRSFGPDLTGVASRFTRTEILKAIIEPSDTVSSQYVNHAVETKDGTIHTGQVIWDGFRKSIIRLATDPMQMDKFIEISKHDIESREPSPTSPMPEGLLNTFTRQEIGALVMFLEGKP